MGLGARESLSDQSARLLTLVEADGGRLYALLVRLTLREDIADDLLQELVVRLSQSDGFQRADDPFAYARRAAIHLAFDWRRQGKKRRKTESLAEDPAVPAPDLLGRLTDREELEQVLAALERLSPLSRGCVVLHYLEQLSYEEVAEQLDMTPHQVRAACHKGIGRLRRLLGLQQSGRLQEEGYDDQS
jgi:RNA polymerase sigma factor (sigma-70 family)